MMKKMTVLRCACASLLSVLSVQVCSQAELPLVQPPSQSATSSVRLPDFVDLVEKAGPAVVHISTTKKSLRQDESKLFVFPPGIDESDPFFEFFRRFFPNKPGPGNDDPRQQGEEIPGGVGSGFIMSSDGYILTNRHVVSGASQIFVTLADKKELKAKLIGSDKRTDIALIKIDVTGLPKINIGDSKKLRVGEWVVAIGSPFGLDNTVTAGIVSAKSRDTGEYLPFIQTDVAVNPGNSGGPLLNMKGEVVGINSQIYSRTGSFIGISFAIPIDEAIRIAEQLRKTGYVIRGRIGVRIAELSKEVSGSLGLPNASGALVESVEPNSPAEKAGIELGDIILSFNGNAIERYSDLPRLVGDTKPGSKVPIQVWRRGTAKSFSIVIVEMPVDSSKLTNKDPAASSLEPLASLGLVLEDLSEEQGKSLRIKNGVIVKSSVGIAARSGIHVGDVVLSVNSVIVKNLQHFNEIISKFSQDKNILLLLKNRDSARFVVLKKPSN